MSEATVSDWLTRFEPWNPNTGALGLDRVRHVWERIKTSWTSLHYSQEAPTTITVAGTNGKGSCVACMESLLLAHGRSLGTYTSPHFLRFNERIRINGTKASDASILEAFKQVESAREGVRLTYFEFTTLAALWLFAESKVHYQLLEVGLGGRLDAVNIIDPDVAVITSIGLDHQSWLGNTLSEIAQEKLGIARQHRPLIWGTSSRIPGCAKFVSSTGSKVFKLGEHFYTKEGTDCFTTIVSDDAGKPITFNSLKFTDILSDTKVTAIQALVAAEIRLNEQITQHVLEDLKVRGRFQRASYEGVPVILDVAHNPAAAELLSQRLAGSKGQILAVASVLHDKDWSGIVDKLMDLVSFWRISEITSSSKGMCKHDMLKVLYNRDIRSTAHESIQAAFLDAIEACREGDTVLVLGSFHTVADVMRIIGAGNSDE